MQYLVVRAQPEDFEEAYSLLDEARAWLRANGIEQWQHHPYPRDRFAEDINRCEVYLAHIDGELAGTITLQMEEAIWDRRLWAELPAKAAYIHRFLVRRKFAGRGLGLYLLAWAERTAAEAGKRFLRLDCPADNPRLCRYYAQAGFESRGTCDIAVFGDVQLFEKEVHPAAAQGAGCPE